MGILNTIFSKKSESLKGKGNSNSKELKNPNIDTFLLQRVMEFLNCEIENCEVILRMEPILLSEDADEIFIRLIKSLNRPGEEFRRIEVETKHNFIRRCREIGIDNAFREIDDKKLMKDFYNSGNTKYYNHDYEGAILDYDEALSVNSNFAEAYNNRAMAKDGIQDFIGAFNDYSKAIEINPIFTSAYFNRAIVKKKLNDIRGAIADYSKVIEINPNDAEAYYSRGLAKIEIGQKESGCMDFRKAEEMGFEWAKEQLKKYSK
jgi:tetratricopeptide (TPR) repeat protein